MAYILNEFTFRTNNTDDGMKKIDEVWRDIASGKLLILNHETLTDRMRRLRTERHDVPDGDAQGGDAPGDGAPGGDEPPAGDDAPRGGERNE